MKKIFALIISATLIVGCRGTATESPAPAPAPAKGGEQLPIFYNDPAHDMKCEIVYGTGISCVSL